jgi:hypothetical protein
MTAERRLQLRSGISFGDGLHPLPEGGVFFVVSAKEDVNLFSDSRRKTWLLPSRNLFCSLDCLGCLGGSLVFGAPRDVTPFITFRDYALEPFFG